MVKNGPISFGNEIALVAILGLFLFTILVGNFVYRVQHYKYNAPKNRKLLNLGLYTKNGKKVSYNMNSKSITSLKKAGILVEPLRYEYKNVYGGMKKRFLIDASDKMKFNI